VEVFHPLNYLLFTALQATFEANQVYKTRRQIRTPTTISQDQYTADYRAESMELVRLVLCWDGAAAVTCS